MRGRGRGAVAQNRPHLNGSARGCHRTAGVQLFE